MSDDIVHNHVEECEVQGVYLGHSTVPIEREAKLSAGPSYHSQPVPLRPKESENPEVNPIRCENPEAYVLIQGNIRLLEIQEYLNEDRLPHGHKLL